MTNGIGHPPANPKKSAITKTRAQNAGTKKASQTKSAAPKEK
ncbi:MAG TPA: hypothetical protein VFE46_01685 [Pirellulales bacterium]|jgi:hypothetical protein|nr:hypothetical protein [Pirellulales bacterium]